MMQVQAKVPNLHGFVNNQVYVILHVDVNRVAYDIICSILWVRYVHMERMWAVYSPDYLQIGTIISDVGLAYSVSCG